MTDEKPAEVVLSMGKWHLEVNGVIVATEGDVCRDMRIRAKRWNRKAMEQAAAHINDTGGG